MTDYSNLQALGASAESEAEYVFERIPGKPSVWCSPLHDSNKDFLEHRLRISNRRGRKIFEEVQAERQRGAKRGKPKPKYVDVTVEDYEDGLADDRELVAAASVRRWGTPFPAADGKVHPLDNPEERAKFVNALPLELFEPFRNWLQDLDNFAGAADDEDEREDADQSGNS